VFHVCMVTAATGERSLEEEDLNHEVAGVFDEGDIRFLSHMSRQLYKRTGLLHDQYSGIWPPGMDKVRVGYGLQLAIPSQAYVQAVVNCAALAQGGSALVTGDDGGLVKLFKCPVPQEHVRTHP